MTEAEFKLKICKPLDNVKIEGGKASTSGPHLGDFLQAAEDKSLLRQTKFCSRGFVLDHLLEDCLRGL